jgi:hypothetical protein
VDSETGAAGGMLHMRRGDVLSVSLTAVPDATSTELRAIERVGGTLSIELCMRKRKRVDDFAEEGDSSAASAVTGAALVPHGKTSKASRRRERKRRAAGPAVPTADSGRATSTIPSALEPDHEEISACSESEHTGSDTEWSEGFSSDDEDRRKTRPPKRMRRLAREIRDVQVTTSDDDNGNASGQTHARDAGDDNAAAAPGGDDSTVLGALPGREDNIRQ